jgi:hypothetical protein
MVRVASLFPLGLLLAASVIGGSGAQVLYTLESPNAEAGGYFGVSVSGAGDVDGNGYEDVVVGAECEDGGAFDAGRAYIFTGQTGTLLHTLQSPNAELKGRFGYSVSGAEDVNNDGYSDVVVGACGETAGAPDAGRAYVFSGQTGSLLYTFQSPDAEAGGWFGFSVCGAGDVNNDDHDDALVGACREDGGVIDAGRAYIFSGQTGGLLYTLQSPNAEPDGWFSIAVSGLGDANNDGHDDVVVGAFLEDGGAANAGRAYVFSGQTGTLLHTLQSPNPEAFGYFGGSVSEGGDVNGDGYDDVVVGALYEDPGTPDAGRAYVFSGQTGSLLWTLQSPNPETDGFFGLSISGAGDADSDGYDDVVVGAYGENGGATNAGRAYVFSGQTGSLLWTLQSPDAEYMGVFGYSVSGVGDVNNAGYDDVIVGAFYEDGGAIDAGRAYVFAPVDVPVELALFRANPDAGSVRLTWLTLSETDNLGFNLDRALMETGPFARVNKYLIRGAGTASAPHTYSYLDETVESEAVYWYRLEDVSLSGERTFHDPIKVFVPGATELGLDVLGGCEPSFVLSSGAPGHASLVLYDVSGRRVASVWKGEMPGAGTTTVRLEDAGTIAPGLYTAVLSRNGATLNRRVVVTR